jgi:hypothetical protein
MRELSSNSIILFLFSAICNNVRGITRNYQYWTDRILKNLGEIGLMF